MTPQAAFSWFAAFFGGGNTPMLRNCAVWRISLRWSWRAKAFYTNIYYMGCLRETAWDVGIVLAAWIPDHNRALREVRDAAPSFCREGLSWEWGTGTSGGHPFSGDSLCVGKERGEAGSSAAYRGRAPHILWKRRGGCGPKLWKLFWEPRAVFSVKCGVIQKLRERFVQELQSLQSFLLRFKGNH